MEHTNNYNLLYFRFTRGKEFLKSEGHALVDSYALRLDTEILTQEEAKELHALVDQYGKDEIAPELEARIAELEEKLAQSEQRQLETEAAMIEIAGMVQPMSEAEAPKEAK